MNTQNNARQLRFDEAFGEEGGRVKHRQCAGVPVVLFLTNKGIRLTLLRQRDTLEQHKAVGGSETETKV